MEYLTPEDPKPDQGSYIQGNKRGISGMVKFSIVFK
jgi:hypothetical protein